MAAAITEEEESRVQNMKRLPDTRTVERRMTLDFKNTRHFEGMDIRHKTLERDDRVAQVIGNGPLNYIGI